jgi:hypothetical protein
MVGVKYPMGLSIRQPWLGIPVTQNKSPDPSGIRDLVRRMGMETSRDTVQHEMKTNISGKPSGQVGTQ